MNINTHIISYTHTQHTLSHLNVDKSFNLNNFFHDSLLGRWCCCRSKYTYEHIKSRFWIVCKYHDFKHMNVYIHTARSREDATWSGHQNAKWNPWWSSQVSFRTAHLKRDLNFENSGFRFAFRRAFRASSSRNRAVYVRTYICTFMPTILSVGAGAAVE